MLDSAFPTFTRLLFYSGCAAFTSLLQLMWEGTNDGTALIPTVLKQRITKFAPRFQGYEYVVVSNLIDTSTVHTTWSSQINLFNK